jgi:two-component system response regulator CpxR
MSIISVFSGTFCRAEQVIHRLASETSFPIISDKEIVERASQSSGLAGQKVSKAFSAKTSVFNKFTHEKERSIAHLRLAVAERLVEDNLLLFGFIHHLIAQPIPHVLRVCLIADMRSRVETASAENGLNEKEALKILHAQDEDRGAWVSSLRHTKDPWDPTLYDIVLPTDKKDLSQSVVLVSENLQKAVVRTTDASRKAVQDFLLGARVEVALADEGHDVSVQAKEGMVTLIINKHVLLLSRLEEELKSIATGVNGVKSVATKVGEGFYQADIYRKYDFQMPSKVLLVDDEREFVETLSERLMMRDVGSAVAYDGESALHLIREDEPEVMILDLKMPGIDGIEVLRRVKATRPEIEVIILTGHGTETDRQTCMALGAFAYLQKPVDIDLLGETLKKANEKIQKKKAKVNERK